MWNHLEPVDLILSASWVRWGDHDKLVKYNKFLHKEYEIINTQSGTSSD